MIKKIFTEEQYNLITDCFDELAKEYNMGLLNTNLVMHMQDGLFNGFDFINDWPEIVAIANPRTREQAHDQYVEKEKKCFWTNKRVDERGECIYLKKEDGAVRTTNLRYRQTMLTESEIREWGYNPDMFYREEVE